MKPVTLLCAAMALLAIAPAWATSSDDIDIGSPSLPGGTSFSSGVYTISGCGADIWGTSDQFHLNKGQLRGDGTVTARVVSVGNTNGWAKSGVMLRGDSSVSAAYADVVATPNNGVCFMWRASAGASCSYSQASGVKAPVWVKLTRTGNSVSGAYSTNGSSWTAIGSTKTVSLGTTPLAGIAVCSHVATSLSTSTFSDVSISPTVDTRYLHVQSNEVRDTTGKLVTLRGFNIGGWLLTEHWMSGITFNDPTNAGNYDRYIVQYLEQRFGSTAAAPLINAWRDNWFTDVDFDNVKSYGTSVIRVPFSWRVLQDANGNWYTNSQGGIDFSRFDWTVQEAAKRGIYVIFDLHDWNGRFASTSNLFTSGSTGDTQRAAAAQIWSQLALHFKGNGTVAAFDLVNEPDDSNDNLMTYQTFYNAIRAQDPNRMVVAESVNPSNFPSLGFTNAMSSYHYVVSNQTDLAAYLANPGIQPYSAPTVPFFVGEVKVDDSVNATQAGTAVTEGMDQQGWAWASWCYKGVNVGNWAALDYDGTGVNINIDTDSAATILANWTTGLRSTSHLSPSTALLSGIEAGLAYSPSPLVNGRTYELINVNSAQVVNLNSGTQGTQVDQYNGIGPASADKWIASLQGDGNWTFQNQDGFVLDDSGAGTANDTPVIQWPATGANNQEWTVVAVGDGTYRIVNSISGLDMEVPGSSTSAGTGIDQYQDVAGAANEHWTFDNVYPYNAPAPLVSGSEYSLINFNSGRAADAYGGSQSTQAAQYNTINPSNPQEPWLATQLSDGNWTFANQYGLLLDALAAGTSNGTEVIQWPVDGGANQEWKVVPVGDGSYKLVNANSNLDMEVPGGSRLQGTGIDLWTDTGGDPWECWGLAVIP